MIPSTLYTTCRYLHVLKRVEQLQGFFFDPIAVIHFFLLFITEFILSFFTMRHKIGTSPLFDLRIIKEDLIIRSEFWWLFMVRDMPNVM